MQIPEKLLHSLEGIKGFNKETFEQIHQSGEQVTSIRFNPKKSVNFQQPPANLIKIPWSSQGYYLSERPSFTFDPIFHAGCYYVQEASSMFLEETLKQTTDLTKPLRVLDLCAAPGGKSTLIQSLISNESLLVSNEVIKSRANILEENIIKWGATNVIITNNDPKDFTRLENYFDVIVIDAPCSGSGLFRKEPEAINEWSEENVHLCNHRQQRIIADVWTSLKQNGILIYSTCSYSTKEDEDILDWISEEFSVDSLQLAVDNNWNIIETKSVKNNFYGYRFYPDKLKGEGFFIAALQKKDGDHFSYPKIKKQTTEKLNNREIELIKPWINKPEQFYFFKHNDCIHALPQNLSDDLLLLQSNLYLKKAGTIVGKLTAKELIPDHELALSTIINNEINAVKLSKEDAIQYLRKEEIKIDTTLKGWALAQYQQQNLGWIKCLGNRINNYYPKEWRILKR